MLSNLPNQLTQNQALQGHTRGCSFWFVQFLQRQCKSQVQLPSLSSGVAQSLPQPPHFSQLSTFGPPPTFNFRPPPPSDRQEVQLSAERGLPVIRVGILLCTSYLCKCLLLWQDQIYNFSGRCHAFDPFQSERGGSVPQVVLAVIRACRAFGLSSCLNPGRSILIHPLCFANQGKRHTQYKVVSTKDISR